MNRDYMHLIQFCIVDKYKLCKMAIIVLLLFMHSHAFAKYFDVHYMDNTDDFAYIDDHFSRNNFQQNRKSFETILLQNKIEKRRYLKSTKEKLLKSLTNPKVIGVMVIAHSKGIMSCVDCEDKAVNNVHLLDSEKKYIEKEILSASHQNLRFIGIVSCFGDFVANEYVETIQNKVGSFKNTYTLISKGTTDNSGLNNISTVASELNFMYQKLNQEVKLFEYFNTQQTAVIGHLEIKYRDLLSKKFNYIIAINGKMIGSLKSNFKTNSVTFEIDQALISEADNKFTLEIYPSDSERTVSKVNYPIDNIIVDEVTFHSHGDSKLLLDQSIQIGDADKLDKEIRMSLFQNRAELRNLDFVKKLELEASL